MKKVLIIGQGGKDNLLLQKAIEEYGDDVKLYTAEEAMEQGLTQNDFVNLETYKITALPIEYQQNTFGYAKSGQERRRERRAKRTKK